MPQAQYLRNVTINTYSNSNILRHDIQGKCDTVQALKTPKNFQQIFSPIVPVDFFHFLDDYGRIRKGIRSVRTRRKGKIC